MKEEIDFSGLKKEYDRKVVRKLSDMRDFYKDGRGKDRAIYQVFIKDYGRFLTGLTVINPGSVNKEYYMTKGHKHKKAGKEMYLLIKGKGKLVLANKKAKVLDMKKNKIYIIPEYTGHRLVNDGNEVLEVLTIYSKDFGHSYGIDFGKRFFKK